MRETVTFYPNVSNPTVNDGFIFIGYDEFMLNLKGISKIPADSIAIIPIQNGCTFSGYIVRAYFDEPIDTTIPKYADIGVISYKPEIIEVIGGDKFKFAPVAPLSNSDISNKCLLHSRQFSEERFFKTYRELKFF